MTWQVEQAARVEMARQEVTQAAITQAAPAQRQDLTAVAVVVVASPITPAVPVAAPAEVREELLVKDIIEHMAALAAALQRRLVVVVVVVAAALYSAADMSRPMSEVMEETAVLVEAMAAAGAAVPAGQARSPLVMEVR